MLMKLDFGGLKAENFLFEWLIFVGYKIVVETFNEYILIWYI